MNCKIHKDTQLVCLKCVGAKGGAKRAKRHTKKQLGKWAKLGGRPKTKAETKKKGKKRRVAIKTTVKSKPSRDLVRVPQVQNQAALDKVVEQYSQPITDEPTVHPADVAADESDTEKE